jgi:hypothetical protein
MPDLPSELAKRRSSLSSFFAGAKQTTLWEREFRIETGAAKVGVELCRKRLRTDPLRTKSGGDLFEVYFDQLSQQIGCSSDAIHGAKRSSGRPVAYGSILLDLEPDTLAFLTLWCILRYLSYPNQQEDEFGSSSLPDWRPCTALVEQIAKACREEQLFSRLRSKKPNQWRPPATARHERFLRSRLAKLQKRLGFGNRVQDNAFSRLGDQLVGFAERVGIIQLRQEMKWTNGVPRSPREVKLYDSVKQTLNKSTARDRLNCPPFALPMVIKPKPRIGLEDGGYFYRPSHLVKHWDDPFILKELKRARMPDVTMAVNALQETPWRINKKVLEVMRTFQDRMRALPGLGNETLLLAKDRVLHARLARTQKLNLNWLKLTSRLARVRREIQKLLPQILRNRQLLNAEKILHAHLAGTRRTTSLWNKRNADLTRLHRSIERMLSTEPHGEALFQKERLLLNQIARTPKLTTEWDNLKAEVARVRREMKQAAGYKILLADRMRIADLFLEEKCIYFPYQLDSRGRAYPIPAYFHPQSDDFGRVLLEFADGKRLGKSGAYWLAVHLANSYGEGLDKRPFIDRVRWVRKNRRMILRICKDPSRRGSPWLKAKRPWRFLAACLEWASYLKKPKTFISHIPVAMDGTCNGLQHLSAMARSATLGATTNLMPSAAPQDVYREVAEDLKRLLTGLRNQDQLASVWLDRGINRKITKPATMHYAYAEGSRSRAREILLSVKGCGVAEAQYLSSKILECIKRKVSGAGRVMDWLKGIAGGLADQGNGVCWRLPTGFVAVVERHKYEKRAIPTSLGRKMSIDDKDKPLGIDKNAQTRKIVPDFVHSYDAAHMMLTVNALRRRNIRHFAMVHDSFAVHACNVTHLNLALRRSFVQLYRRDVLLKFAQELRRRAPDQQLSPPPPRGELDVSRVLRSPYFFS